MRVHNSGAAFAALSALLAPVVLAQQTTMVETSSPDARWYPWTIQEKSRDNPYILLTFITFDAQQMWIPMVDPANAEEFYAGMEADVQTVVSITIIHVRLGVYLLTNES